MGHEEWGFLKILGSKLSNRCYMWSGTCNNEAVHKRSGGISHQLTAILPSNQKRPLLTDSAAKSPTRSEAYGIAQQNNAAYGITDWATDSIGSKFERAVGCFGAGGERARDVQSPANQKDESHLVKKVHKKTRKPRS